MTSIEHDSDAGPADLLAGNCGWADSFERVTDHRAAAGQSHPPVPAAINEHRPASQRSDEPHMVDAGR